MIEFIKQDITGKRVLIREDLNVPIKDGRIVDSARLEAALPTIKHAIEQHAKVMVMAHLGRPVEGEFDEALSLASIAAWLSEHLDMPVPLYALTDDFDVKPGEIALIENVRFNVGELANDDALGKQYARLCDVFVMDAFGVSHRAQASTVAVATHASLACAGPLLTQELHALNNVLKNPAKPLVLMVGGAKTPSKLPPIEHLLEHTDTLVLGGVIANTFLAASDINIGQSLFDDDYETHAHRLLKQALEAGVEVLLPVDVVVSNSLSDFSTARVVNTKEVPSDAYIIDIGPRSVARAAERIAQSATAVWSGSMGLERDDDNETNGTHGLAKALAASSAYSLIGGGDTSAEIRRFGLLDDMSYVSTGGGAFLQALAGNVLPAVDVLNT